MPQRQGLLIFTAIVSTLLACHLVQAQSGWVPVEKSENIQWNADPRTALTLEDLQNMALESNPTLEQARAGLQRANGRRIQAGLSPNPRIGYTSSEIGNDGAAGQQGAFISQEIVRGGKLRLSQAVASHAQQQAQSSLTIQEQRVLSAVRLEYVQVLAAEQMRTLASKIVSLAKEGHNAAEASLRDRGTRRDVIRAKNEVARAELLLIAANIDYDASWRRLRAVIGNPDLRPTPLTGDLRRNIPNLTWEDSWNRLAANSPLLTRSKQGVDRARAALHRARVEPIPNVTLQATTQYDFSTRTQVAGIQLGFPLPIRNRNQGNIIAAQADYLHAVREVERLKWQLQHQLADVFRQYATNRAQVDGYRRIIKADYKSLELSRDLVKAGELNYIELLTAQRTYTQSNKEYIQALSTLWENIVRIDGLLLVDGLASPVSQTDRQ
ncbi:MAG: TolC family protein [Planctomycetes bacterium]|nr:TolC family protein [Planctomycetota bacterium]